MVNWGVTHSDHVSVDPEQMPTAQLFEAARTALLEDDGSSPNPFLCALHRRASREVFDGAARMLSAADPATRHLGALILRELGPQGQGHRPFRDDAVPLLVDRLHQETDPWVLRWVISALGYNSAREALVEVLQFTGHADWRVRFHVAAALPALVDPERIDPRALDALKQLCRDDDADTRYYALYALVEELPGISSEAVAQTLSELLNDPDEQIRNLASLHRRTGQ